MAGSHADQAKKPSKIDAFITRLRARYEWLDHLIRAGARYSERHGSHYAAAITYFSVLALVPLLMIAFSVAGFVLASRPELLQQLESGITGAVPGALGGTINDIVDKSIQSAGTVGVFGLVVALYSGVGWMSNLREALTEQWGQPSHRPPLLKKMLFDLLALIGLGLAMVVSLAVTAVGSGVGRTLLDFLGLGRFWWAHVLLALLGVLLGLAANWVVLLWTIAGLPRQPVSWRSAVKAAALGAVGFEVIKQVMVFYLASVSNSPAGAAFGSIIGLFVFVFFVSQFVLFVAAWAATSHESEAMTVPPPPGPAVIKTEVVVRGGLSVGTSAGLVGAGALLGLLGSVLLERPRR
ncbi:MAG: inner membrane protein YhjD [Pseudonocardia sp.]|nr:inner membrane protein YhjD [Pseudonocardia sp.]